jgi:5-methylcytosine-specific restriction endonuclease McrA
MPNCSLCHTEKEESQFYFRNDTGNRYTWCKKCHKAKNDKNKYAQRQRHRELIEVLRWVSGGACKLCGDTKALEFDHIDPATKLFQVTACGRSPESIVREWEKCMLLCRACHLERTRQRTRAEQEEAARQRTPAKLEDSFPEGKVCRVCGKSRPPEMYKKSTPTVCRPCLVSRQAEKRRKRREYINAKKRVCADCGGTKALEFDHVGPKKYVVAQMNTLSESAIDSEIGNCEVVCHSCHKERTAARRARLRLGLPFEKDPLNTI